MNIFIAYEIRVTISSRFSSQGSANSDSQAAVKLTWIPGWCRHFWDQFLNKGACLSFKQTALESYFNPSILIRTAPPKHSGSLKDWTQSHVLEFCLHCKKYLDFAFFTVQWWQCRDSSAFCCPIALFYFDLQLIGGELLLYLFRHLKRNEINVLLNNGSLPGIYWTSILSVVYFGWSPRQEQCRRSHVAVGALSRALPLVPPPHPSWRQEHSGDVDGSVFLFGLAHFPGSISAASPTVSQPAGTKGCHSLLLCWGNLQPGAFPSFAAMEGLF